MNFYQQNDHQLFHLSGLGLLKISGQGASKLLQGQLSVDIEALADGQGMMGAHCNPQGRVISLFTIFNANNHFYLAMPRDLLPTAKQALLKYAPFYKATLEDVSDTLVLIGAQQPPIPPEALATYTMPESTLTLCLLPELPTAELGTYEQWQCLTIQAGMPELTKATSGVFLPHDLNLPALGAINFNKGCYTGQEIIARMHYRGKPKNHLYHGFIKQPEMSGTPLYTGDIPAGTIVTCAQIKHQDNYALLFVASETVVAQHALQTGNGHIIELQKSE